MAPRRDKYGIPSYAFNVIAWLVLGVVLPAAYVWTLPLLAKTGAVDLFTDMSGDSTALSGYISTTEGTGFMAFTFMFPVILMWSEEAGRANVTFGPRWVRILYFGTLLMFTICFGLFLALPTLTRRVSHAVMTFLFSVSGVAHFLVIALRDRLRSLELAVVLLGIPIFSTVGAFAIYQGITNTLLPPFLYWSFQALSFTILVLFTPIHVFLGQRSLQSAGLSQERMEELAELFASYDKDGSGSLDRAELLEALATAGVDLSDGARKRANIDAWDVDGNGKVTFPEFVDLITAILRETAPLPQLPARAAARLAAGGRGAKMGA